MKTVTTVTTVVQLEVDCEACGNKFVYERTIRETSSTGLIPHKAAGQKVQDRVQKSDFSYRKCPNCGYLQSWMQQAYSTFWGGLLGFISGVAVIIPAIKYVGAPEGTQGWSWLWVILAYVVVFFVGFAPGCLLAQKVLFVPNGKWHRENGHPELPVRAPKVNLRAP